MEFLISCDLSSLVIDKLCDDAIGQDTAVTCFYFDYAEREDQSPTNILGSLLKQLVSGSESIPEAIVQEFRSQKKLIGGRRPNISGILKMFQTITTTVPTFVCIDAIDECAPEHRVVVLDSLAQILRGSPNTRVFMTGRPHVRSEVERSIGGRVDFTSIEPTADDVLRYLRERLRKDRMQGGVMNSTLEANILESIPEASSKTYVEEGAVKKLLEGTF